MVSALEANAAAFLAVAVLGIGGILLAVSLLSWRRVGHRKLLFVALAFGALAVQGAWGAWRAAQGSPPDMPLMGAGFAAVLLLYGSVAAR